MTPALWYLVQRTVANATARALAGLHRPSRLLGLVVGLAYLIWLSRQAVAGGMPDPARATTAGALGLMVLSATAWIAGTVRPPAEAVRSLLWPAPIRDRDLVTLSLVASQALVIPNVILWTMLASRGASMVLLGRRAIALWLLFSTLMYHRALVGRVRGRSSRAHAWLRRGGTILGFMLLASIPFALTGSFNLAAGGFERLGTSRFGAILLWPFQVPVRPVSASTTTAWLGSLPAAVLLLGGHIALLLRLGPAREPVHPDRAAAGQAVRLPARGAVALAAWKSVTAVMRRREIGLVTAGSIVAAVGLRVIHGRGHASAAEFAGFLALTWMPLVLVFGPQFLRTGLRRDADHLPLLRTLPLRGHSWVLGGAIGGAVLTALLAGALLLVGLGGAGTSAELDRYGALRTAGLVAVIVLMMPIAMLGTLVQDALFLLFPGPLSLGSPRPGAMRLGTSLLNSVFATALLLLLLALPAGAGIGMALLAPGPTMQFLAAGVAAALVALGEVLVLARWLGARLDRTGTA